MSVAQQSSFFGAVGIDLSGQRVLVVEDEFLIASYLVDWLRECGAVVVGPAARLGEALLLAKTKPPLDCALLDIDLQGDMAFPVADALAERGVPFVFLTGYRQDVIPARYANVPRYEKPFDHAALMQYLSSVLVVAAATTEATSAAL